MSGNFEWQNIRETYLELTVFGTSDRYERLLKFFLSHEKKLRATHSTCLALQTHGSQRSPEGTRERRKRYLAQRSRARHAAA